MSDTFSADSPGPSESAAPVSSGSAASDDITASAFAALEGDAGTADDASSASSSDAAAPPAAGTIAPPAASVEPAPEQPGPIPFDRHKAALENARTKAAEEATAALRQRYSWAEQYDQNQVEQGVRLYQWLNANPQGFQEFLNQQLSAAGKVAPAAPEPPQPDLRAEDGTPVYSAGQMQKLLEFQQQQLLKQVQEQFGPLKEKDQRRELEQQADTATRAFLTEARANWPMFKDLEPAIKSLMLSNRGLDVHDAYVRALREQGLPKLNEQWRSEYEGALAKKSAATSARPGVPAAQPRDYKNMTPDEITAAVFDQLEAGGAR